VAEAQATIDAELAVEVDARAAAAAGIPDAAMTSYERLRTRLDGVAVARLVNGRCDGCHLSLSRTELAVALREPPDTLLHCEQCGRILVR
jgi:predicted  nucleic acid-binding Zn-ribbon protein